MKLSAPIHILKSQAKGLKKSKSITMAQALNEIARNEGYSSWSLLQAKAKQMLPKKQEDILEYLNPGDMMLIGARPGAGKTTFVLQLLLQAAKQTRKVYFFSLEYNHKDVAARVAILDETIGQNNPFVNFDFSDAISSRYVIEKTQDDSNVSMIAIDYLQLLDQQRSKPDLQQQVQELKQFAKAKGCIVIFIAQVDRAFEMKGKKRPGPEDIRLPNPLDLKLFNKTMFIHKGKKIFTSPVEFEFD